MIAVALVVMLVLVGFVIMLVLWRVLSRHATKATVHLQSLSQDYLLKQEELKQRLDQSERSYQEQLVKVRTESDQIKRKASDEAEAMRQKLLAQAREEYEKIVQRGIESRDAMKRDFEQLVDQKAIDRACEMVLRALPEDFRQVVQSEWVRRLIESGLADAAELKRQQKVKEVRVTTAAPLSDEQKRLLLERLRPVLGAEVTLREQVDAALVAGIVISAGDVVLDGSLAGKLREVVKDVRGSAE